MGEIGIPRKEFLYELKMWELQLIIRGYRLRARPTWESARFAAYYIMSSMADLKKAGIHNDRDLATFPWERDISTSTLPSEEEIADLQELIRRENEKIKAEKETENS